MPENNHSSSDTSKNIEISRSEILEASQRLMRKCEEIITPIEALKIALNQSKKAIIKLSDKGVTIEEITKLFNEEFRIIIQTDAVNSDIEQVVVLAKQSSKKRTSKK